MQVLSRFWLVSLVILVLFLALTVMITPSLAGSQDQVVDKVDDSGPGSLRQAIDDVDEGGTITFDLTYPATITLIGGQLVISKSLTIQGPGAESLTISGNDSSRVFNVTSGTVTISGLTVTGGKTTGTPAYGGGIRNVAVLTLRQVTVEGNRALANPSSPAGGGGIINMGSLTLDECSILNNAAWGGSGQPASTGGGLAIGGGILNLSGSTVTVQGSSIEGNLARAGDDPDDDDGGTATGGGLYNAANATLVVENSTIVSNTAQGGD
ncbi:MAG: right-handed parallel beta-helix repeat-containing protein, partial [Anaerolineae bacterium]